MYRDLIVFLSFVSLNMRALFLHHIFFDNEQRKIWKVKKLITYDKLWVTMKNKGISQYDLYSRYDINRSQLHRLRNNANVTIYTLDKLCNILSCNIEDIVEHIPDDHDSV